MTLAFDLFVFLKGVTLFNILLTKIDNKDLKGYENCASVALHLKLFPSSTQKKTEKE